MSIHRLLFKVVILDYVKFKRILLTQWLRVFLRVCPRIIEEDGVKPTIEFTDNENPTYLIGS